MRQKHFYLESLTRSSILEGDFEESALNTTLTLPYCSNDTTHHNYSGCTNIRLCVPRLAREANVDLVSHSVWRSVQHRNFHSGQCFPQVCQTMHWFVSQANLAHKYYLFCQWQSYNIAAHKRSWSIFQVCHKPSCACQQSAPSMSLADAHQNYTNMASS